MAVFAAGMLWAFGGCALLEPAEEESSPDITLRELEKKMLLARDPQGVFLKAKSYVQKQIITTDGESKLVEVKYLAPDKYKIVTLSDNEPDSAIIVNGSNAWQVNYTEKRVTPITGESLTRLQTLYQLGNPDDSYQDLFAQVNLTQCKIGDDEYYKLTCISKSKDQPPFMLYVSKKTFLVRRMYIPEPFNYRSTIVRYGLFEGVMIPEETKIDSNGAESTSRIILNKLNATLEPSEFLPPVFRPEE